MVGRLEEVVQGRAAARAARALRRPELGADVAPVRRHRETVVAGEEIY